MINLKLLRGSGFLPTGFWFTLFWILGIGIKNDTDKHGTFVMFSLALWKLQLLFTVSLATK